MLGALGEKYLRRLWPLSIVATGLLCRALNGIWCFPAGLARNPSLMSLIHSGADFKTISTWRHMSTRRAPIQLATLFQQGFSCGSDSSIRDELFPNPCNGSVHCSSTATTHDRHDMIEASQKNTGNNLTCA